MLKAFDFVIFGGAGDLALRKLLPGLYRAYRNGELPSGTRILGICRREKQVADYQQNIRAAAQEHLRPDEFDDEKWQAFSQCVYPIFLNIDERDACWDALAELLNVGNDQRVFYLATPPGVFGICCKHLSET